MRLRSIRSPCHWLRPSSAVRPLDHTGPASPSTDVDVPSEHEVRATHAARISELFYAAGESVAEGDLLLNQELYMDAPGMPGFQFMLTRK